MEHIDFRNVFSRHSSPVHKIYAVYYIDTKTVELFVLHESFTIRKITFPINDQAQYGDITVSAGKVEEARDFREFMKEVLETERAERGKHNVVAFSIPNPNQRTFSEVMGKFAQIAMMNISIPREESRHDGGEENGEAGPDASSLPGAHETPIE